MKYVESGGGRSRTLRRCLNLIPFLLFPACFIFWLAGYNGHIAYKESSSLFLFTAAYWQETNVLPGGLGIYAANFLTQFFLWPVAGAFLITSVSFLLWALCCYLAKRIEVSRPVSMFIWLAPVAACFVMMTVEAPFTDLFHLLLLFLLFAGYISIRRRIWRLSAALLGFAPLTLLLPEAALIFFYVAVVVTESLYWGRIGFREIAVFILFSFLLIVTPLYWRHAVLVLDGSALYFTGPDQWIFALLPFTAAGLSVQSRFSYSPGWKPLLFSWCLIAGFGVKLCMDRYNRFEELLLSMDVAAERGEWDKIISIADRQEIFSRQMVYYISVALANRGELGEKLFDYPMVGINPFYMPRAHSYLNSSAAYLIFDYLRIPNAGLIYTFDASMGMRYDASFKTLKNLIRLNLDKGNSRLADKYLSVLDRSLLYGDWVKKQRERWAVLPDSMPETGDFFIGCTSLTDAVAQVVTREPANTQVLDYLLCSYLLEKRMDDFCRTFVSYYPYKQVQRIPRYYQQALLVAKEMGNPEIKDVDIRFSDDIRKLYEQFNGIARFNYGDEQTVRNRLLAKFGNTWWCYFLFTGIDGISSPSVQNGVN